MLITTHVNNNWLLTMYASQTHAYATVTKELIILSTNLVVTLLYFVADLPQDTNVTLHRKLAEII